MVQVHKCLQDQMMLYFIASLDECISTSFYPLFLHPSGAMVMSSIDICPVQLSLMHLLILVWHIHIKYYVLFICLIFFLPYRAKPAGNSNDASGMDESDLEKMKQVLFIFQSILTTKLNLK